MTRSATFLYDCYYKWLHERYESKDVPEPNPAVLVKQTYNRVHQSFSCRMERKGLSDSQEQLHQKIKEESDVFLKTMRERYNAVFHEQFIKEDSISSSNSCPGVHSAIISESKGSDDVQFDRQDGRSIEPSKDNKCSLRKSVCGSVFVAAAAVAVFQLYSYFPDVYGG